MQKSLGAFRCPKCGSATSGGKNFCSECGEPLLIECLECGETWRFMYHYSFCPSCGAKVKNRQLK